VATKSKRRDSQSRQPVRSGRHATFRHSSCHLERQRDGHEAVLGIAHEFEEILFRLSFMT